MEEEKIIKRFKSFCSRLGGRVIGSRSPTAFGGWTYTCELPRMEVDTLWVYVHDNALRIEAKERGNIREIERLASTEELKNIGVKDIVLTGHGSGTYFIDEKLLPAGFRIEMSSPEKIMIRKFLDKLEVLVW